MLAPTSRSPTHSWLSFAPDVGAAAEGDGGAKGVLCQENKEKDVPYPFSAIHEDIMGTVVVPSPSPSPQPIVEVAIADLSRSSLGAEHTSEHPPHSHGQYDIV